MKVYGITGSIACGKSTVTNYLREHGYLVIDADRISREALTIDQGCIEKIDQLFHCVHGGIVDRKALGKKVFHDAKAKKMLENIIHPYVISRLKEAIQENQDLSCLFLDIPLLYESHLEYLCDSIIVVYLDEKQQVKRLMERDHIDEEYALTIMKNQISSDKKKEMANIVLDNTKEPAFLYQQIEQLMKGIENERITDK